MCHPGSQSPAFAHASPSAWDSPSHHSDNLLLTLLGPAPVILALGRPPTATGAELPCLWVSSHCIDCSRTLPTQLSPLLVCLPQQNASSLKAVTALLLSEMWLSTCLVFTGDQRCLRKLWDSGGGECAWTRGWETWFDSTFYHSIWHWAAHSSVWSSVPHLPNKRIGFSCCYDYDYYKTLIQIQNVHHSYSNLPCWALNHVTLPLQSH